MGFLPIISAPAENPAQPKGRHGQSIPQGCALKFFWFSLFTKRTVPSRLKIVREINFLSPIWV